MTNTTIVAISASFSDQLVIQKTSTHWEGSPIKTPIRIGAPDLDAIEDIIDIGTALKAEDLCREQGRNAFVSFEELSPSKTGRIKRSKE